MAQLTRKDADATEVREYELDVEQTTIGRAKDNVHVLADNVASRHHAEILKTPEGFVVKDLGSSNGTWVNGKRVDSHELADGDVVLVGKTTFTFKEPPWDGRTVLVDMSDADFGEEETRPPRSPEQPAPSMPKEPPPQAPSPPQAPPPPGPGCAAGSGAAAAHAGAAATARRPAPRCPASCTGCRAGRRCSAPTADPVGRGQVGTAGEPAGFGIRLAAYLLDALILGLVTAVIFVPVGFLAAMLAQRSEGAMIAVTGAGWLLAMAVSIAYILVPWARSGATLGKKFLSLKIVRDDGVEPLGYGKAALRLVRLTW